jgi:hypothetical protein
MLIIYFLLVKIMTFKIKIFTFSQPIMNTPDKGTQLDNFVIQKKNTSYKRNKNYIWINMITRYYLWKDLVNKWMTSRLIFYGIKNNSNSIVRIIKPKYLLMISRWYQPRKNGKPQSVNKYIEPNRISVWKWRTIDGNKRTMFYWI